MGRSLKLIAPQDTILFFFHLIRETVERRRRTGERRRDLIELMSEALTDNLEEDGEDLNQNTVAGKDRRNVDANGNSANEK